MTTRKKKSHKEPADREIVITRVVNAPRDLWEAWTDPKQVAQWWGPGALRPRYRNGTSG